MIELFIVLFVIASAAAIATGVALRIQMKKVNTYEEWVLMIQTRIQDAYNTIRMADIRGSFESDDEVGDAFRKIKATVDDLQVYINSESE